MKADSYASYQATQKAMNAENITPGAWWSQWLTEQDRAELINLLPQDHRKYAREYGLARTWNLIAPTVQAELLELA